MKYVQVIDGDPTWIEPDPQQGHRMRCCDCGLVHVVNFRVQRGKVQFQAFLDKRATAARRRRLKVTQEKP
jgi:hypothetical protein